MTLFSLNSNDTTKNGEHHTYNVYCTRHFNSSLKRWSGLCAKNQKLSVSKLTRIEDATLFEVVILGIFFTLKHIFSLTSGSKNCVATAAGI